MLETAGQAFVLPSRLASEVLRHAAKACPREAVGLIAGRPGGQATTVVPLPNVAEGSRAFLADPYEQYLAVRRLESEGLEVLAIYHSHPDGGVTPSEDDLTFARAWPCLHIIAAISSRDPGQGRLRGFRWTEGGVVEVIPVRRAEEGSPGGAQTG